MNGENIASANILVLLEDVKTIDDEKELQDYILEHIKIYNFYQ